jgi:molybdate transport system substrate-binding protein
MDVRNLTHALVAAIVCCGTVAAAADIKVVAGSAVTPVMSELIAGFERSSGHRVRSDFDGAIGAMTDRILKGESADVIIVSGAQIDTLIRQARVVPQSRVDLAKVGVGVFVRQGAPRPDIASVDAFKRAMQAAKSIGYNDPAAGAPVGIYLLELFERLGIAADMKGKTTVFKQRSERFEAVARGDVEIGFNQISEIVAAPAWISSGRCRRRSSGTRFSRPGSSRAALSRTRGGHLSLSSPRRKRGRCGAPRGSRRPKAHPLTDDRKFPYGSGLPRTSAAREILISTPMPLSAPSCSCSRLVRRWKIASRSGPLSWRSAVP